MRKVVSVADRAAGSQATVLLLGESGSGKEVLARYIHAHSARAGGPFVAVNCATLSKELLESELFGHEKGAFTGAVRTKPGRIEQAEGGTLFLDEIGELDPAIQAKLLRVLQEREFERVGGTRTFAVDVRVVAATHQDLPRAIQEGRFREDLYYRINIITIRVPPLRERPEDVEALLAALPGASLARGIAGRARSHGSGPRQLLLSYPWPGNVRELSNVVERMVVLAQGNTIGVDDLPEEIRDFTSQGGDREPGPAARCAQYRRAARQLSRRRARGEANGSCVKPWIAPKTCRRRRPGCSGSPSRTWRA